MRVLIVSYSDLAGGAALGAYRLHECLLAGGIDSQMLVRRKVGSDDRVIACGSWPSRLMPALARRVRTQLEYLPLRRYANRTPATVFTSAWVPSRLAAKINRLRADIDAIVAEIEGEEVES